MHLSNISNIVHVRQGVVAIDGRFLDLPILPRQTTPSASPVPDVEYSYFLLHKLIGDVVYMAGGAETLGLDEFGPDEDPWTATHLVSEFSLPILDDKLYCIQNHPVHSSSLLKSGIHNTYSMIITKPKQC